MRSDGTKLIRLPCSRPAGDGRCHDREPGWSRDGRFLAVANSAGIAILRANGKFVRQVVTDALLVPPDEASGDPSWAPGGGRLVFTRQPDLDSPDVYVIGTNGSGLRRVATEAVEPVWSIRNRIAIGGFGLFTMNAKGKKLRTVYSREVTSQDWSPAGTRLVYVHDDRLFVVGAGGTNRRALNPPDKLDRQDPVWSPNGRGVIYVRFGPGKGSRLIHRDLASGATRTRRAEGAQPRLAAALARAKEPHDPAQSFSAPCSTWLSACFNTQLSLSTAENWLERGFAPLQFPDCDLALWKVDLQQPVAWIDRASAAVLSADERSHWQPARNHVRRRYLVARIALRMALAQAVDRPPASLRLSRNASGKPLLDADGAVEQVHFNLARTGDCCVIAVTRAGPVGVDVEHVVMLPELGDIAHSRFAAEEAEEIMNLRGQARLRAFFNCWTRKEAYLKARGVGLLAPLDDVVVTVNDDAPAFLSLHDDDPELLVVVHRAARERHGRSGRPEERQPAARHRPGATPAESRRGKLVSRLTLSTSPEARAGPGDERTARSQLSEFMGFCESHTGRDFGDSAAFHEFSVAEPRLFWGLFLDWSGLLRSGDPEPVRDGDRCESARFFPNLQLSYAENLLRLDEGFSADAPALAAHHPFRPPEHVTRGALHARVVRLAAHLQALGVGHRDHVVALAGNNAELVSPDSEPPRWGLRSRVRRSTWARLRSSAGSSSSLPSCCSPT